MLQLSQVWLAGACWNWVLCPFSTCPLVFNCFFAFQHKMFLVHFAFPTQFWNPLLPEGVLVHFHRSSYLEIKIWALITTWLSLWVAPSLEQLGKAVCFLNNKFINGSLFKSGIVRFFFTVSRSTFLVPNSNIFYLIALCYNMHKIVSSFFLYHYLSSLVLNYRDLLRLLKRLKGWKGGGLD